jgi:hypothetical protein
LALTGTTLLENNLVVQKIVCSSDSICSIYVSHVILEAVSVCYDGRKVAISLCNMLLTKWVDMQNGNYPPAQYPTSMYPSSMGPPSSHGLSSTGSRHSGSILNPPHSPSSHFTEAPIRRHTYMPPQQQVPAPPPLQHSYRDQPTQFTPPFWSNQQGY